MSRYTLLLLIVLSSTILASCITRDNENEQPYKRPLEIVKLSDHSYLHVSYLDLEDGRSFACNGYIYANKGEAFVFDTPVNDSIANQLIGYLQNDLQLKVKGVVISHRHRDAVGGLRAFTKANIPSYASMRTADFLKADSLIISHPFKDKQVLQLGGSDIENYFFGEAHTSDNIVSYIPEERLLFGGCMIKAEDADPGNLNDANLEQWAQTVAQIKDEFPDVQTVVPGHGAIGQSQLLDYTVSLFTPEDDTANLE